MSKKNNDYSALIEIVRKKVKSRGVDMKSLLSKIKDEFKRRVLECHYRMVEFEKDGDKWWEIQRLDITGWKEVSTEYDEDEADKTLTRYVNRFVEPKQTVLKEI